MKDRGERRETNKRKAMSRKKKLMSAIGVPSLQIRRFYRDNEKFLDTEPEGKFENNNIANKYAGRGVSNKTNRRKGHSCHRAKLGRYGVAMDWKPHDRRQLDRERNDGYTDEEEVE